MSFRKYSGDEAYKRTQIPAVKATKIGVVEPPMGEAEKENHNIPAKEDEEEHRLAVKFKQIGSGYTFLSKLGAGGMGDIYHAFQDNMEREVAIKVISKRFEGSEEQRKRFMREARAAGSIQHPSIVVVYDLLFHSASKEIFMVMELLKGRDMAVEIERKGPMDWKTVKAVATQVCSGLHEAHKQGIVHRDIKPENIFLLENGTIHAKILDFGIAKLLNAGSKGITMANRTLGSPEYMSPEQASCRHIDHRTDVFSLGATMYEALTRFMPFPLDTGKELSTAWLELAGKIIKEMPPSPRERSPDLDIPEELDKIIMRCLAKDPNERFQSMEELRNALEALRTEQDNGKTTRLMFGKLSAPQTAFKTLKMVAVVKPPAPGSGTIAIDDVSSHKPPSGIKRRKMLMSAAAIAAGLAIAGVGLTKRLQPVSEPIMQVGIKDPPNRAEPTPPDATVVVPDQPPLAHNTHSLEFKVSPEGVEVLKDGGVVCGGLSCSLRLDESHEPVVFTFRKAGYKERQESVVPDSDKSIEVTLEPLPRKKAEQVKKPKDKPTDQIKPVPNGMNPLKSEVF